MNFLRQVLSALRARPVAGPAAPVPAADRADYQALRACVEAMADGERPAAYAALVPLFDRCQRAAVALPLAAEELYATLLALDLRDQARQPGVPLFS